MEIENLSPLSPAVISGQSTNNIAIISCCDRVTKSSLLKAISGVVSSSTTKTTWEVACRARTFLIFALIYLLQLNDKNNMGGHMLLGYPKTKIYECEDEKCPRPARFKAYGSGKEDWPMCYVPGFENTRMWHVSFVDYAIKDSKIVDQNIVDRVDQD